ncbi:PH domain-containing protein [Microbacterium sp. W1N]|uniref:PH domain-containing protein n=1 Tax=Microbacterium festucae TaxID=2977531 RepID=UPI0021C12CEC|nr:PH domain-containing protein [Microbacterium festucae]MCT9818781.1 PH domain-containing protein [Microbacterium festucae]
MTQPTAYTGRPLTPMPGAAPTELRLVRLRRHARRLFWSAVVLIAAAGAVGFFTGNLPAPFEDWMLWSAAGAAVLLLVVLPFARWYAHTYTVTTRRVVEQSGLLGRHRTEISHARGYTIAERRGPVQRMWGTGTLTLSNGLDAPLRIRDVASVRLVHEVLADQVEVSQILAHRDAQTTPTTVVPED